MNVLLLRWVVCLAVGLTGAANAEGFYTEGPLATDKGSILDLEATAGDVYEAGLERQIDNNPLTVLGRGLRALIENRAARFGDGELIDQATAQREVTGRGLDLKIPAGGISRYELDTLQYLKQREIQQRVTMARGGLCRWPCRGNGQ